MTNYKVLEEKEEPASDAPTITTPSTVESTDEHASHPSSYKSPLPHAPSASHHPEVAVPIEPELPSSAPAIRTLSFPYSPSSVLSSTRSQFSSTTNLFTFPPQPLPNPEERANPLSYVTYSWLSPLIAVGATRTLSDNDLFEVRTDYAAHVAAKRFDREWKAEVGRATTAGDRAKASLWAPFKAIYGRNYALAMLAKFVGDCLSFAQPMLLQLLLSSLESQSLLYCMVVAFSLFVSGTLSTLTCNLYWRTTMIIGIQSRNCLITAIYAKALRLSPKARQERSTGQIVNLMSTDASKIDSALGWALTIVACLLQIVIAVGLLLNTLGVSSLAGIAVVIILIPVQGKVVGILQSIRKKAVLWTDRRVKLSNEILQGIKVIKVYAYETAFLKRLTAIRLDEMALVRRGQYVRAGAVTIAQFGPILMSLVAFIVLASTGGDLTPENVFAALVLFNLLRFPLMQLPFVGGMVADALVSKGRIESFLLAEEIVDQAERVDDKEWAVRIENASFSWEAVIQDQGDEEKKGGGGEGKEKKPGLLSLLFSGGKKSKKDAKVKKGVKKAAWKGKVQKGHEGAVSLLADGADGAEEEGEESEEEEKKAPIPDHLRDVNIRIPHGSLTVIVGNVGAGKTSLLSGILGEMKRRRGHVYLSGSVGYCAQSAWIQNASVKDNILFGLPLDQRRYDEVVRVCELTNDLAILPAGDLTEIGERGVNLSGGQKARVQLARGVYFDADILLLDDIFSALDMHVGAAIFKSCMLGTLRHKTRLLVTHQLQYCQFADHILFMQDGRITEQGTFDDLIKANSGFSTLIANYGGGANDEDEQEEEDRRQQEADEAEEKNQTPALIKRRLSRQTSAGTPNSRAGGSRKGSLKGSDAEAVEKQKKAAKAKLGELMSVEERSTGGVSLAVYKYYLSSLGGPLAILLLLFLIVMGTVTKMATDLWLAWWSEREFDYPVHVYMLVYAALGLSQCVFVFLLAFFVARLSTIGAVYLHDRSFASVTRAPLTFFDTTPLGRILHRFSKDQDTIDTTLSESIRAVIFLGAQIVGSLILMCIATPFFVIPLLPCMYGYWYIQKNFRKSSREVKRMDSTTRSPLFAHFSETLTGLSTIRAYHREDVFIKGNHTRLDGNVRAYYLTVLMQRWIGLRLETLASAIVFFSAAVIVLTNAWHGIGVGLAGLSLSYAISMTTSLVFMIRQSIEAEMAMNSVERSQFYAESIAQEKPAVLPSDQRLINGDHPTPASPWPSAGRVTFHHLSMRYRPNLPLILSDISLDIQGGERIGIVGRTGAGKSSLMTALFRLVEPEQGHIELDGKSINDVGLRTLRQSLAIIPQDAVLFTGTVRSNLDPFDDHTDEQLWAALEKSHLKAAVARLELKLEAPVNEGGENFSQGERCQLCLSRAALKKTKVLVMDEATASIDLETDALIQASLRQQFPGTTILTIAHRLATVADYDRILVLGGGKVLEFDTPAALLRKEGGAFRSLALETGETNFELLMSLATQAESHGRADISKDVLAQAQ